jgi:hypothetical protein
MEVGIPSVNPMKPVFFHENRGAGIVENVSRQVRSLSEDLARDGVVPVGLDEKVETRSDQNLRDGHLSAFHRSIELISIGPIDEGSATVELGQRWQTGTPGTLTEKQAEGGFHELRDGLPLADGLPLETRHDGVVDDQGRLHSRILPGYGLMTTVYGEIRMHVRMAYVASLHVGA